MKRILSSVVAIAACSIVLVSAPAPAHAQAWDMPSFFSPRPGEDIGLYMFKPEGSDWGFEGIWRQEGNLNLGVRLGVTDDENILVGAEFYNPLNAGSGPLLLAWSLGAGATFGDNVTLLRIPAGVSVGAAFGRAGGLQFLPYAHPRLAFDLIAFDTFAGEEETDSDFNFVLDLGADIILTPQLTARVGGTVTEGGGFGVGLAYHLGRRLVVR